MPVLVLCHAPLQSSANLLSVTMASSMGAVYYKSMEEYRSTPLRRSASPGIVNYGSSSTRTILGTPSRYRSASPGIVDYGSSSTQTLRAAPSRRRSASPSVAHRTMLATPSALTPAGRSRSPSMATHDGFPMVRKVLPLATQPAVSASRIRVATTPSLTEHVHPLTASTSASGQYPFGTHGYSQMQCIPQYDTGSYTVHPPSQVFPPQVTGVSIIELHQHSAHKRPDDSHSAPISFAQRCCKHKYTSAQVVWHMR